MNLKLARTLTLLILWAMAQMAGAQALVSYSYDACGNRISSGIKIQMTRSTDSDRDLLPTEKAHDIDVLIKQHPVQEKISIEITGWGEDTKASLAIYTLSGVTMLQRPVRGAITEVDLSSYTVGCYILQVTVGENKNSWKIIKE